MKISVSFGSGDDSQPSNKKKNSIHQKPWFWLLIILIASVAVRVTSKNQSKFPFLETDDDDVSSAFSFEPKTDNFTIKESSDENNNVPNSEYKDEPEEPDQIHNNNGEENQSIAAKNESGKSVFHFILNIATKKYHTKECSAVKKLAEEKRMDTDIEADSLKDAKEIIEEQGYDLCGLCDR